MMRVLSWTLRILVFLVVLGFALKNSQAVTLNYFFGYAWEAPLVVLLLAAASLGALLGILAMLPQIFRSRRELRKLRKQVDAFTDEDASSSSPG